MKILIKSKDKNFKRKRIIEIKADSTLGARLRQRNKYSKFEYYYVRGTWSSLNNDVLLEKSKKHENSILRFFNIFQRA